MVILLILLFLVPINNRLAHSEPAAVPERAQREHRKWDMLHRLRVLALTAALVLLLSAIG